MNLELNIGIFKKRVTSNASRSAFFFKSKYPLHLKFKKLLFYKKWLAGRSKKGDIIIRTKGALSYTNKKVVINRNYRFLNLVLISNFFLISFKKKFLTLLYLSSGLVSYVQSTSIHKLFEITILYSLKFTKNSHLSILTLVNNNIEIMQNFFIIKQLPKNKPISLLEKVPGKKIQYARSNSVKSLMIKMDTRLLTSLIKLPSGVLKIFSIFSVGSVGLVGVKNNHKIKINKAGFFKKNGVKSLSRGVAKNPIDHPHGGRAKSIKYQRTPWGKTTKYK